MLIRTLNNIDEPLEQELINLIDQCGGYEPFYNCGYPHIAAYTDDNSTLIGLLSFIPDSDPDCSDHGNADHCTSDPDSIDHDESDNTTSDTSDTSDRSAEISALVAPDFQHQGVFTSMFLAVRPLLKEYQITRTYCALPAYMLNCSMNNGLLYHEYLMQYTCKDYKIHAANETGAKTRSDLKTPSDLDLDTKSNSAIESDLESPSLEFFFSEDECSYLGYLPETDENDNDEPVCVCNLDYEETFTNIYGVYVDEEYRKKGFGTLLIEHLIQDYFEDASDNDSDDEAHNPSDDESDDIVSAAEVTSCNSSKYAAPLILNVTSTNTAACRLYKKCGFAEANRISYYSIM